jgi:hypothetical protein
LTAVSDVRTDAATRLKTAIYNYTGDQPTLDRHYDGPLAGLTGGKNQHASVSGNSATLAQPRKRKGLPTMLFKPAVIAILGATCLAASNPAQAQGTVPVEAVVALGEEARLLAHFDTLYRLTEELVFWQSIAIMGADRGWEFNYNSSGEMRQPYTFRLYNALDESAIEAARAANAIARDRAATEGDQTAAAALYQQHLALRAHAEAIYQHLLAGDADAAAAIFEAEVIALRREIANAAYSRSAFIRERVADGVMDARLGR